MTTHIRHERPDDVGPIREVHRAAFPTPFEADLVDRLRGRLAPWRSFVAEQEGRVVAHVLFTPVTLDPEPAHRTEMVALGPMAVHPDAQGQGIGSALGDGAIAEISGADIDAVFARGHPEWFPKFGFRPARRVGLELADEDRAGDAPLLVLELVPGSLLHAAGKVRYNNVFRTN